MVHAIVGLALFAAAYSLYGGLSAVAWTDIIQVVFLVLGGLVTAYLALDTVSDGNGFLAGFKKVYEFAPEHFDMILDKSNPEYINLPGVGVLVGGLWVANLYYFGFNQYIIQRTLAAKSLRESQKGILFAAVLKLVIPLIVVIPGIAAYVIIENPEMLTSLGEQGLMNIPATGASDKAYPWLMQFLPTGLKGLAIAALAAAIVSSLASMLNSTSTIFTMDIYRQYINRNANQRSIVGVGRLSAAVSLLIAVFIAPLLGGLDQAFQFIQEYTGVVSPGILAVFLSGLFWKKTTNRGAVTGVLVSIPVAMFFKIGPKGWAAGSSLEQMFPSLPWMDQMGLSCLTTLLVIVLISHFQNKGLDDPKGIYLNTNSFKTSTLFNIGAFAIMIILVAVYAVLW